MTTNDITATAAVKPARVRRAKPATPVPTPAPAATSKSDLVINLLLRAKGATPLELIAATDWQPHSVRAFLSGLRKKGRSIVREPRKTGPAAYRIAVAGGASVATTPTDPTAASAAAASDGAS
jgi:hypothetical protein